MYFNDSKQYIWGKKGLIQTFLQESRSIMQFYCNLSGYYERDRKQNTRRLSCRRIFY